MVLDSPFHAACRYHAIKVLWSETLNWTSHVAYCDNEVECIHYIHNNRFVISWNLRRLQRSVVICWTVECKRPQQVVINILQQCRERENIQQLAVDCLLRYRCSFIHPMPCRLSNMLQAYTWHRIVAIIQSSGQSTSLLMISLMPSVRYLHFMLIILQLKLRRTNDMKYAGDTFTIATSFHWLRHAI